MFSNINIINNKRLFIFALSLFTKHCNPLVDTFLGFIHWKQQNWFYESHMMLKIFSKNIY